MLPPYIIVLLFPIITNSFFQRAHRNFITTNPVYQSISPNGLDLDALQTSQWKLICDYHCGSWKGVQTGYDPRNSEVADNIYTETLLELNGKGDDSVGETIRHITSFVASEIRTDCEVCFDSERVRSREMGVYAKGKLKSRFCSNAEVRGPGSNQRGFSLELTLRIGDGRVRALLSYVATDFEPIQEEEQKPADVWSWSKLKFMPSKPTTSFSRAAGLLLTDVVLTRERLGRRPLEVEGQVDPLWSKPMKDSSKLWSRTDEIGQRIRVDGRGDMVYSALDSLAKKTVEEEADESLYRRVFPGDIAVEAPLFILLPPEKETPERMGSVSISAPNRYPDLNTRDRVSVSFQVVGDYLLEEGRLRSQPPRLTDFFVDQIKSTAHNDS
eukprot:gene25148-32807_t